MLEWKDVKEAELGQTFEIKELKNCCKAVYGGVSFPGRRPGFAVVVAMNHARHFESHDVVLLDEVESFDIRELVRQCVVLDFKYAPNEWIGDWKNDAASPFIQEMNDERTKGHQREFSLISTPLLEMEQLYPYILAEIKRLLTDPKQLYLKESKVANYLSGIEPGEVVDLQQGDFPAVEALAFGVLEIRQHEDFDNSPGPKPVDPWDWIDWD